MQRILQIIRPGKHKGPESKHDAYMRDALHRIKRVLNNIAEFLFGFQFREQIIEEEWNMLIEFCVNPEHSYDKFLDSCKPKPLCSCPEDYACDIHKECMHRRVCGDNTKCMECKACNGTLGKHVCTCNCHKIT
jgi:hypothetical protein